MRRLVHPDLYNIWYFSSQITAPPDVKSQPVSVPPYPEVDWTNVNKRFLGNIPNPSFFPIHGCSEDPTHYEPTYVSHNNFITAEFERPCPFGQAYGYLTEGGVIAVPDQVHHGYIWSVSDSGRLTSLNPMVSVANNWSRMCASQLAEHPGRTRQYLIGTPKKLASSLKKKSWHCTSMDL